MTLDWTDHRAIAHAIAHHQPPADGWRHQAGCTPDEPNPALTRLFFPERGQAIGPALDICSACPVRLPCAAENLGERQGIWGGLTERRRREVRRIARELGHEPPEVPHVAPLHQALADRFRAQAYADERAAGRYPAA